jgi:hypothetical protein
MKATSMCSYLLRDKLFAGSMGRWGCSIQAIQGQELITLIQDRYTEQASPKSTDDNRFKYHEKLLLDFVKGC